MSHTTFWPLQLYTRKLRSKYSNVWVIPKHYLVKGLYLQIQSDHKMRNSSSVHGSVSLFLVCHLMLFNLWNGSWESSHLMVCGQIWPQGWFLQVCIKQDLLGESLNTSNIIKMVYLKKKTHFSAAWSKMTPEPISNVETGNIIPKLVIDCFF